MRRRDTISATGDMINRPVFFETDKPPVEEMVNNGSEEQTVLSVQPFLVVCIPPRLTVACSEVHGLIHSRYATASFNIHYALLEEPLTPPRDDE